MICIIAGSYQEAKRFARGQQLLDSEWFYPTEERDLLSRTNFHVIVIGSPGHNIPESYFNSIYELAQRRGRINRD